MSTIVVSLRQAAFALVAFTTVLLSATLPAPAQPALPTTGEEIQVTATRLPEPPLTVPATVTVLSGEELRRRGAHDLASALSLAAGVELSSGGDAGPAASVPALWGLREADAFLLVVDGVPWGGAFNPDLATLELTGVERIEILRGAAPVIFGATSFVGVIHVIHYSPGAAGGEVQIAGGSFSSGRASAFSALPTLGAFSQWISVSAESQGFKDDRAGYDRGHILYRGQANVGRGLFHIDLDTTVLDQDPASPHPREGRQLTGRVPLDTNHNPDGAHIDVRRFGLGTGYETRLGAGTWSTTLAVSHTETDVLRGFLTEELDAPDNARGYRQDRGVTDLYFDSHLAARPRENVNLVVGLDHLYGSGDTEGESFAYGVGLDGSGLTAREPLEATEAEAKRGFSGVYLEAGWTPAPRWRLEAALRLNRTEEEREGEARPLAGEAGEEGGEEGSTEGGETGASKKSQTRGTGVLGISWQAWAAEGGEVWLHADYRNTFKPAAHDFGPEVEGEILEPETAESYEVGIKARFLGGRLRAQLDAFQMDFDNLVLSASAGGLPTLVNAGSQRFRGVELELAADLPHDLVWQLAASLHDSRFRDYTRLFDGTPTRLDGNYLELAPRQLAASGFFYRPARGFQASTIVQHVGERWLNQRNSALAPGYTTWSAGLGYRWEHFEIRADGQNLNDTRPPVSESELGDAQYYRLPARRIVVTLSRSF